MPTCFCGEKTIARDLCWRHYQRQRRTGSTELQPKRDFWSWVDRSAGEDACWPWKGFVAGNGYGSYHSGYAHREAWRLTRGPIPAGLTIDHLCWVRHCCNPGHMQLLTAGENAARKKPKTRAA
jgi:hypothetical protein